MNTQNHLNNIVATANLLEKDSYSVICSREFKFKFAGKQFCNRMGINQHDILDKSLEQFDSPLAHLSQYYRNIHERVLANNKTEPKEYLTIMPENQEVAVFHSIVQPILDEDNSIIGLYIKTHKLNALEMIPLLKQLTKLTNGKARIIDLNKKAAAIDLTDREEFILFMLALGKYDKEIAHFLSLATGVELTRDAITKIIARNLYTKFDVITRSELIIKAHTIGVLDNLPKLLNHPSCLDIVKML